MNGCPFCEDIGLAHAVQQKIGKERFAALADFRTSPSFTDRERAALAFAEEGTAKPQRERRNLGRRGRSSSTRRKLSSSCG